MVAIETEACNSDDVYSTAGSYGYYDCMYWVIINKNNNYFLCQFYFQLSNVDNKFMFSFHDAGEPYLTIW